MENENFRHALKGPKAITVLGFCVYNFHAYTAL